MISMKKNLNPSAVLLIAVLLCIVAYQAGANRTIAPVQPATVATVDLPRVLEGLSQRSNAEAELRQMAARINEERGQREQELTRLEADHEQLRRAAVDNPAAGAEADSVEERLVYETLRYRAWMQFSNEQVDLEQALILQDLYRVVKQSLAEMAESEGYDLVLIDDAGGELTIDPNSRATRTAQIEQQMMSRLMLYADNAIDITDDLVERMNNAYRSGAAAR